MTSIAIIGAGLAGLTLAHRLRQRANVTVFEKSRGVGGRMATRYAGKFEFDHGAQFFTARTAAFQGFVKPMVEAGVVACWRARFAELQRDQVTAGRQWDDSYPHYVGAPRMNSIGAHLATDIQIRREITVAGLADTRAGWQLRDSDKDDLGCFDWVVFTVPPVQAAGIAPLSSGIQQLAHTRTMSACFALMLGFDSAIDLGYDAARVRESDISWISVNSSKPGRNRTSTVLVHSTNAWADANLEVEPGQVQQHLLAETTAATGEDLRSATHVALHRWRYANIGVHDGPKSHCDVSARLAACGDWFVRGRVEAAFTSANDVADKLLAQL